MGTRAFHISHLLIFNNYYRAINTWWCGFFVSYLDEFRTLHENNSCDLHGTL